MTYAVGDVGPGGGLVFLISDCLTYEMAPKTWSGSSEDTDLSRWCSNASTFLSGTFGTAIGTGAQNTVNMEVCTSGPGLEAAVYVDVAGGYSDWFLPSKDELNAMCYYSRNLSASPDPTETCYGGSGTAQDGTFAGGVYGFASDYYWSSSQVAYNSVWRQTFDSGDQKLSGMRYWHSARPIRVF